MSIKQIGADQFYLDARVFKDGRQYRQRENFTGCRKNAERRYYALKEELQTGAEKGSTLFLNTTLLSSTSSTITSPEIPLISIQKPIWKN